jgi:hypothetical protein
MRHVTCHSYHECVPTNNGRSCAWSGVRRTPAGKVCRPSTWAAWRITRPDALVTDTVCKCQHGGVHIQIRLTACLPIRFIRVSQLRLSLTFTYLVMPRSDEGMIAWIPLEQVQKAAILLYAGSCQYCGTCPTKHACNCYNTGYGGAQCQTLASCTKTPPGGASTLLNPPPFGAVVCAAPGQNLYKYACGRRSQKQCRESKPNLVLGLPLSYRYYQCQNTGKWSAVKLAPTGKVREAGLC